MQVMSQEWYSTLTEGIQVIRLNLKDPGQHQKFEDHLEQADLLLTAQRPAALERLGLSWELIHSRYPNLCQVAIVGYPAPQQNRAGHDLTYQAEIGLLSPPQLPRTLLVDLAGVERAISGALALLLDRARGKGSGYVQVSLLEAGQPFSDPFTYGLTTPGGLLGGAQPGYNLYPARSGWVAVATLEGHFQHRLLLELGLAGAEGLAQAFLEHSAEEWERWAVERDLPISAVKGLPKSILTGEENQSSS